MIDVINLTTTAKYNEDAEMWIAPIKGYPVSGRGETPEEAILNARDNLHMFFEGLAAARKRVVRVRYEHISLKTLLTVSIDTDRGATLTEFGIGTGHNEQEAAE